MVKKSSVSQGKVYVVEDILDTKIINGLQHYRVKWKGYSFSECTWEPQQSFNCSRQILNQFLLARAQKQPSFKEKLQRISREKDPILKAKDVSNDESNERRLVKHSDMKNSFEKSNQDTQVKREEEPNSQDEDIEVKYGYQFTTNNRVKDQQKLKLQPQSHLERAFLTSYQKQGHIEEKKNQQVKTQTVTLPQRQSRSQQKKIDQQKAIQQLSSQSLQKSQKTTLNDSSLRKGKNDQQNGTKTGNQFKILSIKRNGNNIQFYVWQDGKRKLKTKQEMHQKHCLELCQYYQRFISFDD